VPLTFTVDDQGAGQRVDVFLAARTPTTRSQLRRHVESGAVLVNGERIKPKRTLRLGETVTYEPPPPVPDEAIAQDIPLEILYEDAELIVVNKPAGLVVHPAAGHPDGTLVNALLAHCGALSSVGGRQRPGIVHRLDKDTSGVMVASKTDRAHHHLADQFSAHTVQRLYVAIAVGRLPAPKGTFDTFHGRHPVHRKRFTSRGNRGRRAVTHWAMTEQLTGLTVVEARLETGRTHQVRVHLADHGAPILADPVYGRTPRDERLRDLARDLGRQALHAAELGLDHPTRNERLVWRTPPPPDMATVLSKARDFDSSRR
jgi:23S rRNA pseudouridine1911/1915/1917 synthase